MVTCFMKNNSCTETFVFNICFFKMELKIYVYFLLFVNACVTKLTLCCNITHTGDFENLINVNDPLYAIRAFCPKTKSCKNITELYNGSLDNSYINGTCCLPCDCSDSCFIEGNCCFDKEKSRNDMSLKNSFNNNRSCVQTFTDGNELLYAIRVSSVRGSYILHQHCLQMDTEAARKCLNPNETKLDESSPVYLNRTGLNYRNVFCLECIGENKKNAEFWPLRIQCEHLNFDPFHLRYLLSSIREETNGRFLQHAKEAGCIIIYDPVYPQTTERCLHPNDVISYCAPLFGNMYNETRRLCESGSPDEIHFVPVVIGTRVYKNIYCAACNADLGINNGSNLGIIYENMNFISLLNTNAYMVPVADRVGAKCYAELEAPEETVCVDEACPLIDLRVGDRCLPLITKIQGFCFDYRLTISFPFNEIQLPSHEQLSKDVFNGVIADSKLKTVEATLIHSEIEKTSISKEGTVDMSMFLLGRVDTMVEAKYLYVNFMRKLNEFNAPKEGSNNTFKIKPSSVGFKPIASELKDMVEFLTDTSRYIFECNAIYAMAKIQTCPAVETSFFTPLEEKRIQVGLLVFKAHDYVLITASDGRRDVVHICKHTFDMNMYLFETAANDGYSLNLRCRNEGHVILFLIFTLISKQISW